jgi:ATP-dependent DNA ligase
VCIFAIICDAVFGFSLDSLYRCILDGEMLVWDTSTDRFAEFGSNQEIGFE